MTATVRRTEQLSQIRRLLGRRQWCAVIAPTHSGKTALAEQLENDIRAHHDTWCVTKVDFSEALTLEAAWRQVRECMEKTGCDLRNAPRVGLPIPDTLACVARDERHDVRCLIIDNVDVLPDEVLSLLASELRRFANEGDYEEVRPKVRCVFLGALKLRYLTFGEYSPLTGVVTVVPLPDLTKDQTCSALCSRLGSAQLTGEAGDALFTETAGHPYLVGIIARQVRPVSQELTADAIEEAAASWSEEVGALKVEDDCFTQAVEYVENEARAFEVVLNLLEGQTSHYLGSRDRAAMCGALTTKDGTYAFRGRMFERAVSLYFDGLRRGDYCSLHGEWERAADYYSQVQREAVAERRNVGFGKAKRRIMDLYLGLSSQLGSPRTLRDAEKLVVDTARHLFGTDRARLWRLGGGSKDAEEVARTYSDGVPFQWAATVEVASSTARNHTTSILSNNAGIIQGIGRGKTRTRWALELHYDGGLPGPWVRGSLQHVEPSLYATLDHAQHREDEETKQREQRLLIHEVALGLQQATEVHQVFSLIVEGVQSKLGFECAQLCIVLPEEGAIRAVESNGAYEAVKPMTERDRQGGDILAIVIRERSQKLIPDCNAPEAHCDPAAIEASGLKSQVIVPLLVRDEAIGVLQVGSTERKGAFSQEDADILQLLADGAAIALQTAKEREALEQALDATGNAMVVVDADGRITSCNEAYSVMFDVARGDEAPLTGATGDSGDEPLIKIAFARDEFVQTLRQVKGHRYIVSAAGLRDPFGHYAGGLEAIGTRNPLYGLTEALSQMITITDEDQLVKEMVRCLCTHMGYSRARVYRADATGSRLASSWSYGMTDAISDLLATGTLTHERSATDEPKDGFECLRQDAPLIVVAQEFAEESLPLHKVVYDSQCRRVLVLTPDDIRYTSELEKEDVEEWVDIPLGRANNPIGKITVDLKGKVHRFALEDLELTGLFSRWASAAMERVIHLAQAKAQAKVAQDVRLLRQNRGLEPLVKDFLMHITLRGGPEFNRAVIFLKQPQSQNVCGFLCHGAADSGGWKQVLRALGKVEDRREFIQAAGGDDAGDRLPQEDRKRIEALRHIVVVPGAPDDPLSRALSARAILVLKNPGRELGYLYECLEWEVPRRAVVCPLVFSDECEGLLYADKCFDREPITQARCELLETFVPHLAAAAQYHRVAQRLRMQVLGLSHAGLAPMVAIKSLGEPMRSALAETRYVRYVDAIVAESQRAADMVRRLLRVTELTETGSLRLTRDATDLASLLRERVQPYEVILASDGVNVALDVPPGTIAADADPELLGGAFAELAANAVVAMKVPPRPPEAKLFRIACHSDQEAKLCTVTFANSGRPVPPSLRPKVFDPFVSGIGGTGVGLWMVQEVIRSHGGDVAYTVDKDGLSVFTMTIPTR